MKNLTKIILIFFVVLSFLFSVLPQTVLAQLKTLPTSNVPEAEGVVEIQAFEQVFANILTIATSLAGIAAFVVLIMGGFKWMTSGGDPKKMESAKQSITYAFIGLVCLILIWLILLFLQQFTGIPGLTIFTIPKKTP